MISDQEVPKAGDIWKHYKQGVRYRVLGIAQHSEREERLILYKQDVDYGTPIWARPMGMWLDEITPGVFRFEKVVS